MALRPGLTAGLPLSRTPTKEPSEEATNEISICPPMETVSHNAAKGK